MQLTHKSYILLYLYDAVKDDQQASKDEERA